MKKLSRSLAARSVFFMLAVCLSSCKQDVSVQPNPSVSQVQNDKIVDLNTLQGIEVKNGSLHFKDAESYDKAFSAFNKCDEATYKSFCEKIGFKSIETIEDEELDRLDKLRTKEEFEAFKKRNKDIFSFENQEIKLKCYSHLTPRLVDAHGLVYIDKSVLQFDDKGFIMVENGDLEKLERAKISRESSNADKVFVYNANHLVNSRSLCGKELNTGWVGGASWRRGIMYIGTEISLPIFNGPSSIDPTLPPPPQEWLIVLYAYCEGRAQKYNTWFSYWTDYKTDHTLFYNYSIEFFNTVVHHENYYGVNANNTQRVKYSAPYGT